jgi:glucose-6-phosphate 1-dehydrogenase
MVRGQFNGYRQEPGVKADSQVETFSAVRLKVDSWRWEGVPFLIRAGKNLPTTTTEVLVQLRRPPLGKQFPLCGNYVRFRLSPELQIGIGAQVKKPGEDPQARLMPVELSAVHQTGGDDMAPYERLLGDAMDGDGTLFARQDGVEAAWEIVDPILKDPPAVQPYEPGTWGPADAGRLAADVGGWHTPA